MDSISIKEQDDITRSLWFHFQSFSGVVDELKSIRDLYEKIFINKVTEIEFDFKSLI